MTLNDAVARVEAIRELAGDYEATHGAEDQLHRDVLAAIASGNAGLFPEKLAAIALSTREIAFERYAA